MEVNDALITAITRELLRRMQSGEIAVSECPPRNNAPGRRKVISEAEVMRLCPASAGTGQSMEIGRGDMVTPLAEDYIAKMRITVNRVG